MEGNTNRVGSTHTAETKAAISEAMSGGNNPNYGKSLSDATKAAISEAIKGNTNRVGSTHSAETKAAISEACGGGTIYVYDSNSVLIDEFPSHTAAAAYLGCSIRHVGRLVKTGSSTRKGYRVTTTLLS
jgi:group I intron endonuclease